jgi:surface protein
MAYKSALGAPTKKLPPRNSIEEQNLAIVRGFTKMAKQPGGPPGHGAFTQAPVLWGVLGPMMESSKKYQRNDGDIRMAVNLWCTNSTQAVEKYGHIGQWNVSRVTNMSELFKDKRDFNVDISGWDVSNVRNMSSMFNAARAFNQPIGLWDVSKVTNMSKMFANTDNFNQAIGDWDVSHATNMTNMFLSARVFDQAIGGWNVSRVTDMTGMFQYARSLERGEGYQNEGYV